MQRRTAVGVMVICGFITMNILFSHSCSHVIHWRYENIDYSCNQICDLRSWYSCLTPFLASSYRILSSPLLPCAFLLSSPIVSCRIHHSSSFCFIVSFLVFFVVCYYPACLTFHAKHCYCEELKLLLWKVYLLTHEKFRCQSWPVRFKVDILKCSSHFI